MGRKKKSRASTPEEDEVEMDNAGPSSEKSLYEVLGVERTATSQEIRKAYHRLALQLHPDKNQDDEEANEKFQQLQKVMLILGDEEKRAIYDQTGSVDDTDLSGDVFENLREFFKSMYKKVTIEDIEEYEANYRGSEVEKKDLIELFKKFKGKMNSLLCSMFFADPKLDSHRYKDILDEAIAAGEVKSSNAYQKWAKKISETEPPTNPSSKRQKKRSKEDSEPDLASLILQRREERKGKVDSMFSSLISRYGENAEAEPSEEEFEAARKRLESRTESKRPSKKSKRK